MAHVENNFFIIVTYCGVMIIIFRRAKFFNRPKFMNRKWQIIFLKVNNAVNFWNVESNIRTNFNGFIYGRLKACRVNFFVQNNFIGRTKRNFFNRVIIKREKWTVKRPNFTRLQIILISVIYSREKFFFHHLRGIEIFTGIAIFIFVAKSRKFFRRAIFVNVDTLKCKCLTFGNQQNSFQRISAHLIKI